MTFYSLQALRFVAASLVLFFHLFLVPSGYKGVDIFFVISGFVMYYTLFARKRPAAVHFIVNRGTKIYFLYWVSLIFLFLVVPLKLSELNIKSVLLVPGHLSLVGVSWSLSFELYFYFIIGTSAYLMPAKYHKPLFIILISVTMIVTLIDLFTDHLQHTTINYLLGPNFWEFLLGILCAFLSTKYYKLVSASLSLCIAFISLVLFLVISITYMSSVSYIIYGPLSALIVLFFTAYEQVKKINSRIGKLFQVLGDASYGIYLFGPVITLIFSNPLQNTSRLIIITSTIGFSILFNRLIENRFLLGTRKMLYSIVPKK